MGLRSSHGVAISSALLVRLSGAAAADSTWILASESAESDTRFLVNASQLDHSVNQHGVQVFRVPLRAVGHGAVKNGYVAIDAKGCLERGGEMIMAVGDASQRFWWSVDGKRMYDAVGASVCTVAAAMYEAARNGRANPDGPQHADVARRRL